MFLATSSKPTLLIVLVVQALASPAAAVTCFKYIGQIGNSGTQDSGDVPCDPNASVSACCGAGSICISNLYCFNDAITTPNVPGTCTDQSFTDPACPCPPGKWIFPVQKPPPPSLTYAVCSAQVSSLDYTEDVTLCPDGSYCCGHNNTACCGSTDSRLEIYYGNPGRIPSGTASLAGYYSSLHVSTKSRSTTISSFPQSTQAVTSTTVPSSSTLKPTKLSSPTTFIPTSTPKSSGLSQAAKIALGTLIPLITVSASLIGWWILQRQRSSKLAKTGGESVEMNAATTGELSSGLDRAELMTRQWDSAELPPNHAIAELPNRT